MNKEKISSELLTYIKKFIKEHIKIAKETEKYIEYDVEAHSGRYNKSMRSKEPQWFKNFADEQREFNKSILFKVDSLDKKVTALDNKVTSLDEKLDKHIIEGHK